VCELPKIIKQHGYIAKKNGQIYEVEYVSGGHLPSEECIVLTLAEMKVLYLDNSKFDELALKAKKRMKEI